MNKAEAIKNAIKSLELVAHVDTININDCTPTELEDLHYGAMLALDHLKNSKGEDDEEN